MNSMRLSVNASRFTTVCAFIHKASQAGVIDQATFVDLIDMLLQNARSMIDIEPLVVEHDPAGCPMLEEWLCHHRSA